MFPASFFVPYIDDTKEYVKIFTNIERLDQLQNYYIRCHKASMTSRFTLCKTKM